MSNQKSFYGATKRLYHSPTPDSKSLKRIINGYRLAALQWRSQLSPSSRQGQSQPSASSQPGQNQLSPYFRKGQSQPGASSQPRKNDPSSTNKHNDVDSKCCGRFCGIQ